MSTLSLLRPDPSPDEGKSPSRWHQHGVRVLIVDDEEPVRRVLARYLRTRGYQTETVDSGQAALSVLAHERVALMICDIMMPGLSGVEVARRAADADPDLAIMMLSALNDAPTATAALSGGALDYLLKPIELADLGDAVERALHKRELLIEQRRVERLIRDEVAQRTSELEREKAALREMSVGIAESLVNAMEAKDTYLRGHSGRVAELAGNIAFELGLSPDTVENVRLAARLQDVGRIGVREAVLNKIGTLTDEEIEHIRDHLRIGMEILSPLKHLGAVLEYVQDHHERWDGEGYPAGKKQEEISIGGRILAAADAFHAITARRAYREPLAPERALDYMESLIGGLLDPAVYAAMSRVMKRGGSAPLRLES
jgi:response regulator RpfG family c-di-GMP phosphodiesterase